MRRAALLPVAIVATWAVACSQGSGHPSSISENPDASDAALDAVPDAISDAISAEGGDASADGGGDAGDAPCVERPFRTSTLLTSVNDTSDETGASLSADERTIVFASNRADAGADLFHAKRATLTDPFVISGPLGVDSALAEDGPSITADALTLYFFRSSPSTVTDAQLLVSTRATANDDFSIARPVTAAGTPAFDPFVRSDGRALYFATLAPSETLRRADVSAGGIVDAPAGVPGITAGHHPVLSPDEETIYWATGSGTTTMYMARISGGAFGAPVPLDDLQSGFTDYPLWVSPDGCRLYYASNHALNGGTKDFDIYVGER